MTSVRDHYFSLGGGLDLVTSPIKRNPGRAIAGFNYIPRAEGYARIGGYERTDGRFLPSKAAYWQLYVKETVTDILAGATITGAASGATAVALLDRYFNQGADYLILGDLEGSFLDGEDLKLGGDVIAVADGTEEDDAATNDTDALDWETAAITAARSQVAEIPGAGPLLGVWKFDDILYAWRNDVTGTACVMHKSSDNGWETVHLGWELAFKSGSSEISIGDTVTGASSNATATVKRVIVQSGYFDNSDDRATGYMVLHDINGSFNDGETLKVAAVTVAIADGPSTEITLLPDGHYHFRTYNFYGGAATKAFYGVDGVNHGFEFDGTVFTPIKTGMDDDTPIFLACHYDQLFYAFTGGSLQNSSLGTPYKWDALVGAAETGIGDEITGLVEDFAGVMIVFGQTKIAVLYGRTFGDEGDGRLEVLQGSIGADVGSAGDLAGPVFYDAGHIFDLKTSEAFGNFQPHSLTHDIKPFLDDKMTEGVSVAASVVERALSLYWLFFDDLTGVVLSKETGRAEFMPVQLPIQIRSAVSVRNNAGVEELYFCSSDGFVRRWRSGTSFDGEPLEYLLRLPFNHLGSPNHNKVFKRVVMEANAVTDITLNVAADFSYGSQDLTSIPNLDLSIYGGGGFWDESNWGDFNWSQVEGTAEAYFDGFGQNITMAFHGETAFETPHTLNGCTIFYTLRGLKR